ncbi:MAG TPA: hypothetical protein VMT20_26200 [Terriglobia bacterium]|nr:hypothetical protein [Terriglobia bacterium]
MLVIISDTHLSDGTTGDSVRLEAFRGFRQRLRDLAYDASWRADGSYKPVEQFDLVLLGDFLDIIRSTNWLVQDGVQNTARPWNDSQSRPFIDTVQRITAAVLQSNGASVAVLKSLTTGKAITLPEATAGGKPVQTGWEPESDNRLPVPVRIHYLVGNHDWFFHLPGSDYNQIRQMVADAIGCVTPANLPFPHDPDESDVIRQLYAGHRVFARHGDIFDPYNFAGNRNRSSVGDAVVVELIARFAMGVKAELGNNLPPVCAAGLKEIDNLRPASIIPAWIDGLLRKTCPDPGVQRKIGQIWDALVDQLVGLDFVRHQPGFHPFGSLQEFKLGMKIEGLVPKVHLSRLFALIAEKSGSQQASYAPHALDEAAFRNRSAQFIVYGHTHYFEMVPLASTVVNGTVLDQIYINSGAWRPYHELTRSHPEREEFVSYDIMTYLAFFKDDENRGRAFESWCGGLGPV